MIRMNDRIEIAREFAKAINDEHIIRIILFGSVAREEDTEDSDIDILCCANDSIAGGVIAALEKEGYGKENWPIITGQDAQISTVKEIMKGRQSMTVFKDTRILADKCVGMVQAVLEQTEPEINNRNSYHNGVITVPSYLCTTMTVDVENYREILIDSGYYKENQLLSGIGSMNNNSQQMDGAE